MDFLSEHRSGYVMRSGVSGPSRSPHLTFVLRQKSHLLLRVFFRYRSPEWMLQHQTHLLDERIARLEAALFA